MSPHVCPVVTASAGSALPAGKVAVFYVLRAALAVTSAYAEARLVREAISTVHICTCDDVWTDLLRMCLLLSCL